MPRPPKPALELRGTVWHYSFTVAGQRFRGTTGERDRVRAESVLAGKWFEAHQKARLPVAVGPAAGLDFAGIAGLWLAAVTQRADERNPQYVARHTLDVRYLLAHFSRADEVTDTAWQTAMRELHDDGLSWASLRHATITLRHVLRFARELGAVPAVPELAPPTNKMVDREQAPRRALTEGERDRVLRAMRQNGDHRAARIWQAMAYSGLRKGELERLTLRWLDVGAGVLRIPAGAAKSGTFETVPLLEKVRQAVRAEAAERKIRDRDVPVFGGFDIRKAWKRALARAKVDAHGLTAHHSARHTFGTLVAQLSNGDVSAVLAAGRWRSLSVASKYVHASAARARAAMRRL